jgi:hypothetical protein
VDPEAELPLLGVVAILSPESECAALERSVVDRDAVGVPSTPGASEARDVVWVSVARLARTSEPLVSPEDGIGATMEFEVTVGNEPATGAPRDQKSRAVAMTPTALPPETAAST